MRDLPNPSLIDTQPPLDERPEAGPDLFSYRDFSEDLQTAYWEVYLALRDAGAQVARFTLINDQYPNPPYPHGVYGEGWSVDPRKMDPPHRAAPFGYPLVAS